ncbi:hypothetical protein [Runella zeae]|uniref:hypothetical protein n=1 Tax=Runella zeae TaxID=94255 RepID=UPI0023566C19|nr:hypothetical protein [Runella zeae]
MSGKDDNDKKKEPTFPEGYEHLDDLMKQGLERRQEIDKQLEALSKDPSKPTVYAPKYTPPGFATGRPSGNKDFTIGRLEAEKTQIETGINERIELQLQVMETDPATAKQIRQTVMDKLHPNVFEGKGEKELERLGKMEKDINASQDYMRTQMKNFREGTPKDPKSAADLQRESAQSEKELNNSQEFMQRQIAAVKERGTEKAPDVPAVQGREEAKGQPTVSMSERFSQSLSYTKALEKSAEKPSPTKTKDDKSPDKD